MTSVLLLSRYPFLWKNLGKQVNHSFHYSQLDGVAGIEESWLAPIISALTGKVSKTLR
jgi:hypothetical protein